MGNILEPIDYLFDLTAEEYLLMEESEVLLRCDLLTHEIEKQ